VGGSVKKKKYTFIIPGNPVPLARARINPKAFFNNTRCKMWDPQKELKLVAAIHLRNQFENLEPIVGAIHIDAKFYMPIPKSKSKKLQAGLIGKHHICKPDLDNLIKFICDCATGILYKDDAVVASINIQKLYDEDPRTEFTLIPLEEII
jgi:Holliday junction resolvase RusA-like endonuclease